MTSWNGFWKYELTNNDFFIKFFHKRLVKTTVKEGFFPIFILYGEGRCFSSKTLEIVKLDKILDPEINSKILFWKRNFVHKHFDKSLIKMTIEKYSGGFWRSDTYKNKWWMLH